MRALVLAGTLLLSACVGAGHRDLDVEMRAVNVFEPEKYLGKWYEIARYPSWFERDCISATAEYSLLDEDSEDKKKGQNDEAKTDEDAPLEIKVVNRCWVGGKDGEEQIAEGKARYEDTGRFNVTFTPVYVSAIPNYWILAQKKYEVAVVGEPSGKSAWILARKPQISDVDINWALSILEANGYNLIGLERVPQKDQSK